MIKLSLCVPIYGVEKEIPRFLDSLEKNLCEGVEVLLIDDGTKDNSGKIADAFAEKHADCVRVIHKPNGGASSARNKGLEMARGKYIIFPDPDDYMTDAYVSTILDAIEKYDAPDMIFFDYYQGNEGSGYKRKTVCGFREGRIDKAVFIREFAKNTDIKSFVWNKAIKRRMYGDRRFDPEIYVAEDYELLSDMVLEVDSFVYIPKAVYYYVMRPDSLTKTTRLQDTLGFYQLALRRYERFSELYDDISICSLVTFANGAVKRIYRESADIDTKPYERLIKDNIGSILIGDEYTWNHKKQMVIIWLGLARWYYKGKKR